jgi:glycosyltransferase involved in cell wall biosynthesis
VKLLLAGNGILEPGLKRLAHSENSSNIYFMNFQNQSFMPVLYQSADLFCLPSFSETWGLSINEAMASGRAVLASDRVGCAIDLVKKDYNGAVFRNDLVRDLTEELAKLTNSETLLQQYGNNSRSLIKNWSFEHIVVAIEDKLNEISRYNPIK